MRRHGWSPGAEVGAHARSRIDPRSAGHAGAAVRVAGQEFRLALAAATAALGDHEFLARSHDSNRVGMAQIVDGVKRLGLDHIPSLGNFVCIKPGDAAAVNQKLLKQGVIVRPIAGYGLPDWLRVTIGNEVENQRFLEALEVALG